MSSHSKEARIGKKNYLASCISYTTRVLFFIAIVVGWEAYVRAFSVPGYLLPPPSEVAIVTVNMSNLLLRNAWVTFYESIVGFLVGAALGVFLAVLIVYSGYLRQTLYPVLVGFQAVPKVAIAPLLVVWFGVGLISKILMALLIAFFPVIVNTASGLQEIEHDLIDLMKVAKATELQIFFKIRLPHSLPNMFDSFKVAMPLAIIGAIVGEFVSGREGLGNLILTTSSILNTALMFATLVVVTVVSIVMFAGIIVFEKVLLRWRPSERKR